MTDRRLAQVYFWANPEEWDNLSPYVRNEGLDTAGAVIRSYVRDFPTYLGQIWCRSVRTSKTRWWNR